MIMKRILVLSIIALFCEAASASAFVDFPKDWKWSEDGNPVILYEEQEKPSPVRSNDLNLTFSPDSSMIAFTRGNDLYVRDAISGKEKRLTSDGSDVILNGYASWVYYEEILGRSSEYKAFWWAPDSRLIGFYRFDNTGVPMFPIYSPFGQDGKLTVTGYPKAGERNPEVKIGIVDVDNGRTVWADFDEKEDQYFGIPFWNKESDGFYVAREPRVQNRLDLYRIDVVSGEKTRIYSEVSKTWLDWIKGMIFTDSGLYMARHFETGWDQIYFLSYDGKKLKRLSSGRNWRISLIRYDEPSGNLYFTAHRDSDTKDALYLLDPKGRIKAVSDPAFHISKVRFSPDGRHYLASMSNYRTPDRLVEGCSDGSGVTVLVDSAGDDFNPDDYALPEEVRLNIGGLSVPGYAVYPKGFDPSVKYPVHIEIYGGPNTAYVKDMWRKPSEKNQWWSDNGIIHMVLDVRASGHNGLAGTDLVFKDLTSAPIHDFVAWAKWLKTLPYVDGDRIGVEGFSFGGTMTSLLVMEHGDCFCCGIAGGGVYDWRLYDSHYTERFMLTPQLNPEGYEKSGVINHVKGCRKSLHLKLTHGTGDDNVHFQNTLQLVDALQKEGVQFELMVYPDGKHGYKGVQGEHSDEADRLFWSRYLLGR